MAGPVRAPSRVCPTRRSRSVSYVFAHGFALCDISVQRCAGGQPSWPPPAASLSVARPPAPGHIDVVVPSWPRPPLSFHLRRRAASLCVYLRCVGSGVQRARGAFTCSANIDNPNPPLSYTGSSQERPTRASGLACRDENLKSTCTLTCTASTVALPLALEDIPSSEHHIVVAYAIAHRIPTPNNKCRQNERAPRVPRAGLLRGAAGGGRNARRLRRQTSTETSTETPRGDSAGNKSQGVVPGAFRLTLLGRSTDGPAPGPPPA